LVAQNPRWASRPAFWWLVDKLRTELRLLTEELQRTTGAGAGRQLDGAAVEGE
jgi:hypothetical protein